MYITLILNIEGVSLLLSRYCIGHEGVNEAVVHTYVIFVGIYIVAKALWNERRKQAHVQLEKKFNFVLLRIL